MTHACPGPICHGKADVPAHMLMCGRDWGALKRGAPAVARAVWRAYGTDGPGSPAHRAAMQTAIRTARRLAGGARCVTSPRSAPRGVTSRAARPGDQAAEADAIGRAYLGHGDQLGALEAEAAAHGPPLGPHRGQVATRRARRDATARTLGRPAGC